MFISSSCIGRDTQFSCKSGPRHAKRFARVLEVLRGHASIQYVIVKANHVRIARIFSFEAVRFVHRIASAGKPAAHPALILGCASASYLVTFENSKHWFLPYCLRNPIATLRLNQYIKCNIAINLGLEAAQ